MTKEEILSAVLDRNNLTIEDIKVRSRKSSLYDARSQYIYFVWKYIKDKGVKLSWSIVCEDIGYKEPSMYFHALNYAEKMIEVDKTYRETVFKIDNDLRGMITCKH